MLEVAKGFGILRKIGWKPRRTIIFGSWSGEELGLLGSTAWGEKYAKTILKNAVAYLNVVRSDSYCGLKTDIQRLFRT